MVRTVPQLYRYIYDRAERATQVGGFRAWVSQFTAANLRTLIDDRKPDVVVCTHAFPCGVMAEYKRTYAPKLPILGIVTDFVVHPFWIYRNVDAYAVATPEMHGTLVARGVQRDRVIACGIPVDPRFVAPRRPKEALRRELELPAGRKIVLMMAGGLGMGPLDVMMRALGEIDQPLAAAIIVGRNAALERRVLDAAEQIEYPLRVRGFVDNVFDYMHASDVLLTKPGGLTSSEALVAGLPMIFVRPLPGQEERNTRYLVSRRAAVRVKSARHVAPAVAELLRSGERLAHLRANMQALRHPDAADVIAQRVLALAETPSGVRG